MFVISLWCTLCAGSFHTIAISILKQDGVKDFIKAGTFFAPRFIYLASKVEIYESGYGQYMELPTNNCIIFVFVSSPLLVYSPTWIC